jgi:methylglutaconyl-CoA hydratase
MTDSLQHHRNGAVVRLRLDRPGLHNAFDANLIETLTAALVAVGKDKAVRVVVLEGAGPSFSAGADLNWMHSMIAASQEQNRVDALALAQLPHPTIARVQGAAFGGGVGLIACCDIAIGSDDATFGLTESKLGLLPAVISPYVIAAIGARQARRWFATAELFDAAEAQRIGLLHAVVPADGLDAAVKRQVDLLLKAGPLAASHAKLLVRRVDSEPDRDKLDRDNADLIARLRVSPEGQEGLAAFLEKRKPGWVP